MREEETTGPEEDDPISIDLGIAQTFIAGGREGWEFTLEHLGTLLERIRGGTPFLDIATEKGLSEADASLGALSRDELPDPAFAEAAFALEEGQVSEPVEGRLTTALLRVTDVKPADQQPLSAVRDELANLLQGELGRERVLDIYDAVEDGRAAGQSFEDIAADLGLEVRRLEIDRSGVDAQGNTGWGEPVSKPGDHVIFRAAMDCICAMSCCPQDILPINGKGVAGRPFPREFAGRKNSRTAYLAFSETWVTAPDRLISSTRRDASCGITARAAHPRGLAMDIPSVRSRSARSSASTRSPAIKIR